MRRSQGGCEGSSFYSSSSWCSDSEPARGGKWQRDNLQKEVVGSLCCVRARRKYKEQLVARLWTVCGQKRSDSTYLQVDANTKLRDLQQLITSIRQNRWCKQKMDKVLIYRSVQHQFTTRSKPLHSCDCKRFRSEFLLLQNILSTEIRGLR